MIVTEEADAAIEAIVRRVVREEWQATQLELTRLTLALTAVVGELRMIRQQGINDGK